MKLTQTFLSFSMQSQLVDTTVEIANKVGAAEIIGRVVDDLKDEAEQYRKMVMETIEKVMANLGAADIDSRLEEQLIDGILYAFQEQTTEVCLSFLFEEAIQLAYGKSVVLLMCLFVPEIWRGT
jgi:cysteine sulfinate desulfinase/cysteine desulfurase-like protein